MNFHEDSSQPDNLKDTKKSTYEKKKKKGGNPEEKNIPERTSMVNEFTSPPYSATRS